MCIIGSDAQLNDISHFSAISKRGFSELLAFDLTVKPDEIRVLVTSFKNSIHINNFWKYLTHIRPVQIQHRKLLWT